jgi:predicted peptidase
MIWPEAFREKRSRRCRVAEDTAQTVRLTELPDVAHNAWDPAYADAEALAWLTSQRRGHLLS